MMHSLVRTRQRAGQFLKQHWDGSDEKVGEYPVEIFIPKQHLN